MNKITFLAICVFSISANGQRIEITGPAGSGDFGLSTVVLTNGNYVLADPYYDEAGITDRGAVYLYNGQTHQLISVLKGGTASDKVGYDIEVLSNGNFVVVSPDWDNGSVVDVGAVTWCNGVTGLNGFVSSTNSLIGSSAGDKVGFGTNNPPDFENVVGLPNGNYVVISSIWNNGASTSAGAVTFCNGSSGLTGTVSSANSLVGSYSNDQVGNRGIKVLANGNYVISSTQWSGGGAVSIGAATWASGLIGVNGILSSTNSLTGAVANDAFGLVVPLSNGNYVAYSRFCSIAGSVNGGAVAWGNGSTGISGTISSANCLYGLTNYDGLNISVFPLTNGNYVVTTNSWDNGTLINAGAVTWADGLTGITGAITTTNSFVGTKTDDAVGSSGIVALPDGNYLICSDLWDNAAIANVGAVTWADGTASLTGSISSANSIIGTLAGDRVGENKATVLTNGNYVIKSQRWNGNRGAVTWCDKNVPPTGTVSSANSLTGVNANDFAGNSLVALSNGNYVVACRNWDNGAILNVGAVTWCDGTFATTGQINTSNSIIGTIANDNVGSLVVPLSNGHYVIASSQADINSITDAGAVTWCNGFSATTGTVSAANSFIGTTASDGVGASIFPIPGGNYLSISPLWDGINSFGAFTANLSAITMCAGNGITTGTVTPCNSVKGNSSYSLSTGRIVIAFNNIYQYSIISDTYDNRTTIFYSTEPSLSNHQEQTTKNVTAGSTVDFINNSCRISSTLVSSGASPASGLITSYTWIEPGVPEYFSKPFVARHYQIQFNSGSPATATGRLTLYFTQKEFDDFNNHPGSILDLPTGPSDISGKANLRVGKYSGLSNNGTGLPGSYNSTAIVINPEDNDIIWNSTLNRWEVSFDVTGFSGFIVQTHEFVLPLRFLSFTAEKCNNNQVCLNWKTADEQNVSHFEIERSTDGRNFISLKIESAKNQPLNLYSATDDIGNLQSADIIFYRIKQVDADGKAAYSATAMVRQKNIDVDVFPTVFSKSFTLQCNLADNMQLQVYSAEGRLLHQQAIQQGINIINPKSDYKGVLIYKLINNEKLLATGKLISQ